MDWLGRKFLLLINLILFLTPLFLTSSGMPDLPAEYVIITNQTLEEAFEPVADYITRKGFVAKIYTVSSILENYSCDFVSNICDSAGAIRGFLTDKYEEGAQWVLLGGDENIVPVRYGAVSFRIQNPVIDLVPSDLYYSDLDGNWNRDGDDYYGEPYHDSIDVEPELYVGRIPCENAVDVENWFEKLVSYENPVHKNYFTRFFWAAADQMRFYPDSIVSGVTIPSRISNDLTMVENDDGHLPKGSDVINKMNEHFGFFTFFGHGSPDVLTVSAPGDNNPSVNRDFLTSLDSTDVHLVNQGGHCRVENGNGLDSLTNKDYYGIMAIYSCYHAAYDFKNFDHKYWNMCCGPSIMEAFILPPDKGGPTYIGFTRGAGFTSNRTLHNCLLDKLFNENITRIGATLALTKNEIYPYQTLYHGYSLFGCPLMRVWTEIPESMNVNHDTLTPTGPDNMTITVTEYDGVTGISDAYVCLWKGNEVYERGYTGEDGTIDMEINPTSGGKMSLTVTKENMLPYAGEIKVQEPKFLADKISVSQSDRSQWHTVDFPETFNNPIVVMGPLSCNDCAPTTIRVKDVDSNGFKFKIEEWEYLDGIHGEETISFLVLEEGVHRIGGKIWEAGRVCCRRLEDWKGVIFKSWCFLCKKPIVLTQTVTDNLDYPIVTRIKDVTKYGFKVMIQDEENNEDFHELCHGEPELIHYIAIQAGTGRINDNKIFAVSKTAPGQTPPINHEWNTIEFPFIENVNETIFLSGLQTSRFDIKKTRCELVSDPASLRYKDLTSAEVSLRVQEEQSEDSEMEHSLEDIGYLAVFKTAEDTSAIEGNEICENRIKLSSSIITGSVTLNISSSHERKVRIELIDIAGRIIERKEYKLKKGNEQINFGQFKSGIYFFRILQGEENKPEIHKITVLR